MKRIAFALLGIVLGLAGCASTQQNVPIATADKLQSGNALIRVERASGFFGGTASIEVTDNNVVVGQLAPGSFITWERPAGAMEINLAPSFGTVRELPPIKLEVAPGKTYNFESSWSWGDYSYVIKQK